MISINDQGLEFHLQTKRSSYLIKVTSTGHLIHLHYGDRLTHRPHFDALEHLYQGKLGSSTDYADVPGQTLNTFRLEVPTFGKGDYRSPLLHVEYADGSRVTDLHYQSHQLLNSKPELKGLPSSSAEPDSQHLVVTLVDPVTKLEVDVHYSVFSQSDVITRHLVVRNQANQPVQLLRALSSCVDFADESWDLIHLQGKWIKEAQIARQGLEKGTVQIDSKKGVSSANHNPFIALARKETNEHLGACYGFGLMYSGNHLSVAEVSPYNQTRVMTGINDFDFRWELESGARFTTPEIALTYSASGLNRMSQQMHQFINLHVISEQWRGVERPIQVNNWEATYFDFDYDKLDAIAQKAKSIGVELFVLDDGWFGKRDDDTTSLGDYFDNPKLVGGIARISETVKEYGLKFGIWVEPEMVSPDSELFRAHPEWAIAHPERTPSLGRNQLVLDMANPEVIDYLFEKLSDVFTRAKVDYVKWDHNRNFSDSYAHSLSEKEQASFNHRYVLGLYDLLSRLTKAFPNILFESCSSGGNRFDLGMLNYMPQTWTSDNTDAIERLNIQHGTSLCYPLSSMSAHVAAKPSHQVLRRTPLETRFNVAAFGNFGYQLDITQLTEQETQAVVEQIAFYKQHRQLLQFGRFYRLSSPFEGNITTWLVVNDEGSEALLGYYQKLQQSSGELETIKLPALNPELAFTVRSRAQYSEEIETTDTLVNSELYQLYGDQLASVGLPLNNQFMGVEITERTRHIGDFGSRIYHILAEGDCAPRD
ncbi:alpha-galactosidase [Vibrio sp. 10N]|uniref:alpha-galactosidase n=1 Tax=Vibrio sp. 10N TaxID=3058938 RepID=UPI002813A30F|nr:alpha-galactosidase [Vibrio sp. 10N]